jgi:hypothetical protein
LNKQGANFSRPLGRIWSQMLVVVQERQKQAMGTKMGAFEIS